MKFLCVNNPELKIVDLGVKFRDGEATVTDPKVVAALRALPEEFGVTEADEKPTRKA